MLIWIVIGKWSEDNLKEVCQDVILARLLEIVDISGEVFFWFILLGIRVGESVFNTMWFEANRISSIVLPRWSIWVECQREEWAFMSPMIREFSRDRK